MVVTREITLDTQGRCHLVDITLQVAAEVARSGVRDGIVNIFVVGSTAGVGTTEYEPGLLRDTEELWERLGWPPTRATTMTWPGETATGSPTSGPV